MTFLAITSQSAGAQMCPAAVSSTVYTSVCMVSGYVAQTALFGLAPVTLTLVGAALMLVAVAIMAVTRVTPPAATDVDEVAHDHAAAEQSVDAAISVGNDDETESLAS